jgi:hypothetical protein
VRDADDLGNVFDRLVVKIGQLDDGMMCISRDSI